MPIHCNSLTVAILEEVGSDDLVFHKCTPHGNSYWMEWDFSDFNRISIGFFEPRNLKFCLSTHSLSPKWASAEMINLPTKVQSSYSFRKNHEQKSARLLKTPSCNFWQNWTLWVYMDNFLHVILLRRFRTYIHLLGKTSSADVWISRNNLLRSCIYLFS